MVPTAVSLLMGRWGRDGLAGGAPPDRGDEGPPPLFPWDMRLSMLKEEKTAEPTVLERGEEAAAAAICCCGDRGDGR